MSTDVSTYPSVEFREVSFQDRGGSRMLDGADCVVPSGARALIVCGSHGARSAILRLLLRLDAPTEGSVRIHGRDARLLQPEEFRSWLGFVPARPAVFTGTLWENVAIGKAGTTLGEVTEVMGAIGLDRFVMSLPDCYRTLVGHGGMELPASVRRGIALARAMLWGPQILLFEDRRPLERGDDGWIAREGVAAVPRGRTALVIADRFEGAPPVDLAFVVRDGRFFELSMAVKSDHPFPTDRPRRAEPAA